MTFSSRGSKMTFNNSNLDSKRRSDCNNDMTRRNNNSNMMRSSNDLCTKNYSSNITTIIITIMIHIVLTYLLQFRATEMSSPNIVDPILTPNQSSSILEPARDAVKTELSSIPKALLFATLRRCSTTIGVNFVHLPVLHPTIYPSGLPIPHDLLDLMLLARRVILSGGMDNTLPPLRPPQAALLAKGVESTTCR